MYLCVLSNLWGDCPSSLYMEFEQTEQTGHTVPWIAESVKAPRSEEHWWRVDKALSRRRSFCGFSAWSMLLYETCILWMTIFLFPRMETLKVLMSWFMLFIWISQRLFIYVKHKLHSPYLILEIKILLFLFSNDSKKIRWHQCIFQTITGCSLSPSAYI